MNPPFSILHGSTEERRNKHSKEKLNKWCPFLYTRVFSCTHTGSGGVPLRRATQVTQAHRPDLRVCVFVCVRACVHVCVCVCACACIENPKPCHYRESVVSDETGRPPYTVRDATCPPLLGITIGGCGGRGNSITDSFTIYCSLLYLYLSIHPIWCWRQTPLFVQTQ